MSEKVTNRISLFSFLISWIRDRKFFFAWLLFFLSSAILSIARAATPFISQWDELYHLSYLQYVSEGIIPAPGYPMNDWAKIAFSCYPVSLLGVMTAVPCGELGAGASYPTGGTNTASVWPPIYYIITAILMWIIKAIFGMSDNLFVARYATVIIWAMGTSLLSLFVYKKSKSILLGFSFAFLSTGLSLFGQSASFVSPHSLVPLLLFGGLSLAIRLESSLETRGGDFSWRPQDIRRFKGRSLVSYIALMFYGVFLALSVPHALPILFLIGIYVFIGVLVRDGNNSSIFLTRALFTLGLVGVSAAGFLLTRQLWSWQMSWRQVEWPSDVNPAAMDLDAVKTYPDLLQQVLLLWGDFWPSGLENPWIQGTIPVISENFWIFLLPSLIVLAIATLGMKHWLSRLSLSLAISAPIASNLAFSQLQFVVPERYGLSIVLVGLFGLANDRLKIYFRSFLFVLATSTYILGFFFSPLPFVHDLCPTSPLNWAFSCVQFG